MLKCKVDLIFPLPPYCSRKSHFMLEGKESTISPSYSWRQIKVNMLFSPHQNCPMKCVAVFPPTYLSFLHFFLKLRFYVQRVSIENSESFTYMNIFWGKKTNFSWTGSLQKRWKGCFRKVTVRLMKLEEVHKA